MGFKSHTESDNAPDPPTGYAARLASLRARAAIGLAMSASLLMLAVVTTLLMLPATWPVWVLIEAMFLAVWYARKRALDRVPEPHLPPGHCAEATFSRFAQSIPVVSEESGPYDLIGRWFDYPPASDIRRQNVRDLLSYGFGYRRASEYDAEGQGTIPDALQRQVEAAWGTPFADGLNQDLRYMAHLREPLRAYPKPLFWYLLAEGLAGVKHVVLRVAGFRCERHAGFTYYTYGLPAAAKTRRTGGEVAVASNGSVAGEKPAFDGGSCVPAEVPAPLVFSHGVGLGLLPYVLFVMKLAALGRPVVAIEYKHLSMRWTWNIPTVDEGAAALLGIMDSLSIRHAAFIGHSFGTFFLSRLNRLAPERVACMALVDPVCMCMWSGHLIRSFVYQPHLTKSGPITWAISRDIHTATAVARNFFWSDYNMWPDTFPNSTLVVLSGRDDLVPLQHVTSMVQKETRARLMLSPEAKHGDFLFDAQWQAEVLSGIWRLLDECGGNKQCLTAHGKQISLPAGILVVGEGGKAGGAPAAAVTAGAAQHTHSDSAFSFSFGSFVPSGGGNSTSSSEAGDGSLGTAECGQRGGGRHAQWQSAVVPVLLETPWAAVTCCSAGSGVKQDEVAIHIGTTAASLRV